MPAGSGLNALEVNAAASSASSTFTKSKIDRGEVAVDVDKLSVTLSGLVLSGYCLFGILGKPGH